jgi:hypothetical protein
VSGQITFDSESPPREGAVYFAPIQAEEGYPKRPGRAMFGLDGDFVATSYEPRDGLVPGEYRVNVECWKTVPGPGSLGVSYVNEKFAPDNLVISSDQRRVEFNLDVPIRR